METVLIRPSDLQVDPLTPQVFTPPIGLWSIPETPRTSMIDTPFLCRHTLERLKSEDREAAIARRKED